MPFGYPVFLELAGRRAVVIGETAVREGKVEGLLAADVGDVTVVAERPAARLESLAALDPRVTVERRAWRPRRSRRRVRLRRVLGRSGGAVRDRARSARSRRAGERHGRHPELRLGRAVDRPPRRAGARDLDRRRLPGAREDSSGSSSSATFGEEWAEVLAVLARGARGDDAAPPRHRRTRRPVGRRARHSRKRRRSSARDAPTTCAIAWSDRLLGNEPAATRDRVPGRRRPGRSEAHHGPRARRCSAWPTSSSTTGWRRPRSSTWRRAARRADLRRQGAGPLRHAPARDRRAARRTRAPRPDGRATEGRRPVRVRPRRRGGARVRRGRRRVRGRARRDERGRGAGARGDPGHASRVAQSFAVVTGSTAHGDEVDLARVATSTDTLVVLMAAGKLAETCAELIAAGRPATEPAAIVQWAATPEQRTVVGTLERSAGARGRGVDRPAGHARRRRGRRARERARLAPPRSCTVRSRGSGARDTLSGMAAPDRRPVEAPRKRERLRPRHVGSTTDHLPAHLAGRHADRALRVVAGAA